MDCLEVCLGHKNELAGFSYLIRCIRCNGVMVGDIIAQHTIYT